MPKDRKTVKKILQILDELYPQTRTQLNHRSPFELLIATILSAQCTDRQVNQVTPKLFERFPTPESLANARIPEIEKLIRSTGFFHNKAKNIKACANALLEIHQGKVPHTLEELTALPGVGRKTANVVLNADFGIPGVVVDTHVKRISFLLGLTDKKDPEKIEYDLMEVLPRETWIDFSLQLIYHGRSICKARKPDCPECPLRPYCDFGQGKI